MTFGVLFQPLYFLMLLMYFTELQTEEDPLAIFLDVAIIVLGVVFMVMQACMLRFVGKPDKHPKLRRFFYAGLVIWFFLEVVFSYTWCFVTGADPLWDHTPFVMIFLIFNLAQYWGLKKLGVLDAAQ
jgi:amino acid transporter